jgi:hypothetical protein
MYFDLDHNMIYDAWLVPSVAGSSVYNNCRWIKILKEFGFVVEETWGAKGAAAPVLIQSGRKVSFCPHEIRPDNIYAFYNAYKSWTLIILYVQNALTLTYMHL